MKNNLLTKLLKKLVAAAGILLAFVLLLSLAGSYGRYQDQKNTKELVLDHLDFLNDSIESEDYERILELEGVQELRYWKNDGESLIIEYFCKGAGIAPGGRYAGFYYTSEDQPVGYEGTASNFTKEKNGWRWEEKNGDNYEYTERIAAHWYYYEAGF